MEPKISSERKSDVTRKLTEKAKSNPVFINLKNKTTEAVKISSEKAKELQKESPKYLSSFKQGFFSCFEEFIGTIRKGTQYGKTSIKMLEELAKMKELGIINEDEFESKKKQILDRI